MKQKINQLIAAAESLLASDIPKSAKHKCLEIELATQIKAIKSQVVDEQLEQLVYTIESNFKDSDDLQTLKAIANGMLWSEKSHDAITKLANFIDRDINAWNELHYQLQNQRQNQIEEAF